MSIRSKTKRRFAIVLALLTLVIVAAVCVYVVRARQFEQQLQITRDEGLEALESGQFFTALHKIGRYAQRHPEDVESLYAYARARSGVPLEGNRHLTQAVGLFSRVIAQSPQHLGARRAKLELLVELNYNAETLQSADELLQLVPDDAAGLRAKAVALSRAGRPEEAITVAEQRNAIYPLDMGFRLMTLRLMREAKYPAKRITDYATAEREKHPNDPRFDLLLAGACAINSDQDGCSKWLKAAIAHDITDDPETVKLLASYLDFAGLHVESIGFLNRATAASGDMGLTTLLADRWMQLERWPDLAERLAGLDPERHETSGHLLGLRAIALIKLKRQPEAMSIVEVLARRKDDPAGAAWASLIPEVYNQAEAVDPRKQLQLAENALARVPTSPYFADLVAEAYGRMGEVELALRYWEQAAAHATAWGRPHLRIAEALIASNRQLEAVEALKESLSRWPEDPEALATVATFAAMEATPDAEVWMKGLLEKIEGLAPERDMDPVRILYLVNGNRREKAIAVANALVDGAERVPETTLLSLARISSRHGLGIEQRCVDRARADYGLTPQIASYVAEVEYRAGRTAEGRAILEGALANAEASAAPEFKRELARYLERAADPGAGAMWVALADAEPDNTSLQWEAFYARSMKPDRDARDRLLNRVTGQIGDKGVAWRIARAQWTMEAEPEEAKIVRAASLLAEAVRIAPRCTRARVLLAECLDQMNNQKAAIDQLAQAAESAPREHDIALRLGEILAADNDLTRAQVYARRVMGSADATPDQARRAALLLAESGDIGAATAALKQMLDKNPQDHQSRLRLAQLRARRGQRDEVDRMLPDLLAVQDEEAIGFAVIHYLQTGRLKEAAELVARLDQSSLAVPAKAVIKADYFTATGDEGQALQQLQLATESGPEIVGTWRSLMLYHLDNDDCEKALSALEQAAARLPQEKWLATLMANRELIRKLSADSCAMPVITAMVREPDQTTVLAKALGILAEGDGRPAGQRALVEKLRPLAESHPRMIALQVLLARCCLAAERTDEAVQIANRLLHLHPNDPQAAQSACGILTLSQKWEELVVAGRRWRSLSPGQSGPDLALARGYLNLGLTDGALRELQPYLDGRPATSPQHVELHTIAATAFACDNLPDRAESLLQPLLKDHESARASWIGIAAERLRDYAGAASWLTRASNVIPSDAIGEQLQLAHAWFRLAFRSGDPQHKLEGRRQLDKVADSYDAQQPAFRPEQVQLLGMLYEAAGDAGRAEFHYRRALELSPGLHISANNLAMILLASEGKSAEAVAFARRAVELDPDAATYHDTLGLALIDDGRPDEAARSFARALELDPRNGSYCVSLADAQMKANNPDEARAAIARIDQQNIDLLSLPDAQRQRLESLRGELRR